MAMAQGGPVAIEYAARHPERVTRLMFYGSYAGRDPRPDAGGARARRRRSSQLIKVGWARPDSEFRRVFTSLMIPGATEEQMRWLDELQRVAVVGRARRRRPAPADARPTSIGLLAAARPADAGAPLAAATG